MKRPFLSFCSLVLLLFLTSCSGDEAEYSVWPCRFAYDNQVHNDLVLASAMNNASRGIFCLISEHTQKGVKYLKFENNNGDSSQQPETAEEKLAKFILGLNNGIIVGFQTLNTEDATRGFVAYDVQCPNCVRRENNTVNPNYRVEMDSKGIATCNRCGKTYDLNNGGIVTNGGEGDRGLEKYVANTTGPIGYISVYRR